MNKHDEGSGDDPGYTVPRPEPTTTAQKLVALAEAEQRVKELREELRADYECVRALFGRVRKPKADKPKAGRPKGSKNVARKIHAEPSSQPAE